jgi:hypothetical protein
MFAPLIFVVAVATPPVSTHGTCTLADFNGDGVYDTVDTVEDSCGTGGCVYDLALANGRKLGRIDGLCSFELERRKNQWADIVTIWRLGAVESVETRYRFDGRRYRQIAHHTHRAR